MYCSWTHAKTVDEKAMIRNRSNRILSPIQDTKRERNIHTKDGIKYKTALAESRHKKAFSSKPTAANLLNHNILENVTTGHSRYVDFIYLDTTTYVEEIFHSQHFFSIFLWISTPSMSKTVIMKQRVSRGDVSCPRRIFYYICYCLCRSIKSVLTWAPYCLLRLCTCISWGANIFQTTIKIN